MCRQTAMRRKSAEERQLGMRVVKTLGACGRRKAWAEALDIMAGLQTDGHCPDAISTNALLGACAKAGRWRAAEVPQDTVAYTSAVSAFALRSSWQRAAQLLEMAQDCGLRCDVVLRSAAASACEKGGAWRSAVQLADSGQDTQLLNIALLAATRRGSRATWASALAHVAAMTPRSLRRDGFTFSPLQNLGWARALELLRFLRSCSLRGEAALGNLLAPPWRQSVDLLGVMGADLRQDAANFNAAGSACGKAAWEQMVWNHADLCEDADWQDHHP
ncbi:unnamed protein product [Effrenium voratum]|uniref:Pentatricopeptide repeat-containing protein, chloroplastic n=1 Tax=Effrenium voratum TaxID=2562239 RepID=A0AA36I9B8_9DINO|nr:unnamed protein product [Effrenium voratum]